MKRRVFIGTGALAPSFLGRTGLTSMKAAEVKNSLPGPIADTTGGKIRGILHGKAYAFRGVPYGASTAGAGRFMPPAKVEPWTGVRDAFELGSKSPQAGAGEIPEVAAMDMHEAMGEDCLRLNVWTSGLRDGHKRPVMVWLHGGGYAEGSGGYIMYDGANLAGKHDVVMVTVNHRLNIFGYLYLADLGQERFAKAANAGQLDIIAALEWVRDNIGGF